jgi:RHS repeat-associated protein
VANVTQWQYDALNRKSQETDPLFNTATFGYDAIDRLASTTDRLGQVVTFGYDLLNRRTAATGYSGSGLLNFGFDANDNLLTAQTATATITQTYDALDRLSTAKDGFGTLATCSYDAANNRTAFADSFGGLTTRTYDALNRTTTLQFTGQSASLREDFAYTVRDQVSTQKRYSDLAASSLVGSSTLSYDSVMRLTNLQHLNGAGANIANFVNSFDLASRITAETLNGGAPVSYQYDTTNQLTSDAAASYSYDLNGNRTMAGYGTGPGNQITTDGTWNYYADKNGNIVQKSTSSEVWAFGFDNRNRLTTVTDSTTAGLQMQATYGYDAVGQRVQKDVLTGGVTTTTRFAYDQRQIWADSNGANALQVRYQLGDLILERLARVSGGGTAAWLLADRMGSIRNVVDSTGTTLTTNAFDGYGNLMSQSGAASAGVYLAFAYRYDAETVLLRPDPVARRYYDPLTGRWRSIDDIWDDVNLWRYVRNNTPNATDPSGYAFMTRDADAQRNFVDALIAAGASRDSIKILQIGTLYYIRTDDVDPLAVSRYAIKNRRGQRFMLASGVLGKANADNVILDPSSPEFGTYYLSTIDLAISVAAAARLVSQQKRRLVIDVGGCGRYFDERVISVNIRNTIDPSTVLPADLLRKYGFDPKLDQIPLYVFGNAFALSIGSKADKDQGFLPKGSVDEIYIERIGKPLLTARAITQYLQVLRPGGLLVLFDAAEETAKDFGASVVAEAERMKRTAMVIQPPRLETLIRTDGNDRGYRTIIRID